MPEFVEGVKRVSLSMRDMIIETASELFMKQGYLATSTRQIAKKLNITQPALYFHFKNKEELYTEVLSTFTHEIGVNLNALMAQETSFYQKLYSMADYLQRSHVVNFSMMMHDINSELSEETQFTIFIIWKKNYFDPFDTYFIQLEKWLRPELSALAASRHFLRNLSAYIMEDQNYQMMSDLDLGTMVDIFLRGIVKPEYLSQIY